MLIAQQSVSLSFGTVAANSVKTLLVSNPDPRFKPNLPIIGTLDSQDTALETGLSIDDVRLALAGANAGKLEVRINNPTTGAITPGGNHVIWLTQVE